MPNLLLPETIEKHWRYPRSCARYSIPEAAKYLRIAKSTLYRWCRNGKLPVTDTAYNLLSFNDLVTIYQQRHGPDVYLVDREHGQVLQLGVYGEATILLSPDHRWGWPCVHPGYVSTQVLAGRIQAGDSVKETAWDYGITQEEVRAAVKFEMEEL